MSRFIVEINDNNGKETTADLANHIAKKFGAGVVNVRMIRETNEGLFVSCDECGILLDPEKDNRRSVSGRMLCESCQG